MESLVVFGAYFFLCICCIPKSDYAELKGETGRKKIVVRLAIATFLLGALRSPYTGVDTVNYINYFSKWRVGIPVSFYWEEALRSVSSEKGYYILERLFYSVCPNEQIWLAFLCLIFVIPCAFVIYRYSGCPPLSFIYLVSMTIYTFTWQGLKQNVALSICIIAFLYLMKGKKVLYLILVFLAFQFHRSSMVFLLVLPAMYINVEKWDFLVIPAAFFVSRFTPGIVISGVSRFLGIYTKLAIYLGTDTSRSTYTMFFILLLLYIGCYTVKDELIKDNPVNKTLLNLSLFGVSIQAMAVIIAEFFRISYYFSIFNMILVANASKVAMKKYPLLKLRALFVVFLIFIFFALGGFDYWFFWENKQVIY